MNKKNTIKEIVEEESRSSIGVLTMENAVLRVESFEKIDHKPVPIGTKRDGYILDSTIEEVGRVKEIWLREDYADKS